MTSVIVAELNEVDEAVRILRAGGLVAIPTETVYGLAADATNEDAVKRVFAVKGRPSGHPLILHFADAAGIAAYTKNVPDAAHALAKAFWPGPLTMVLERGPNVLDVVTGGRDTVAVRVPNAPLARTIIAALERPVAAPSANRFGRTSPTTAEHVRKDLGTDVALVLDGGPASVGVESTIIDMTTKPPMILRVGGVSASAIESEIGPVSRVAEGESRAPGMLEAHYAPSAKVELVDAKDLESRARTLFKQGARVATLAQGTSPLPFARRLDVGATEDSYAQSLYACLRDADAARIDVVLAVPPSDEDGLGAAIADRLRRAAAAHDDLSDES